MFPWVQWDRAERSPTPPATAAQANSGLSSAFQRCVRLSGLFSELVPVALESSHGIWERGQL